MPVFEVRVSPRTYATVEVQAATAEQAAAIVNRPDFELPPRETWRTAAREGHIRVYTTGHRYRGAPVYEVEV